MEGFRQAVRAWPNPVDTTESVNWPNIQAGSARVRELLRSGPPFSALFAFNDLLAVGAIEAAKQCRLRVPEDLAVVGFDDIPLATVISPKLTSVHPGSAEMGERSMSLLADLIAGQPIPEPVTVLQPKLMVRESSSQG